jgi:hypothetical protein
VKERLKLFANIFENLLLRWECVLEWYLLKVDTLNSRSQVHFERVSSNFVQFTEKPENSNKLLKLTLSGLVITFTVLLFSCQTLPPPRPLPQAPIARKFDTDRQERNLDQLYLKRDEFIIKNRETGSSTGSIWADTQEPRALLADPTPSREGQTITVVIPPELQFDPKSVTVADNLKSKDKGNTKDKKKDTEPENTGLKLTDPDSASPTIQLSQGPIKSFKMQIVGFEPGGDVYLRGQRRFVGANGEENLTMVLAKVPRRALTGFQLDARELTDVAVNEDIDGRQKEYTAPGWDEMVSRRLSGFTPDMKSEMSAIDGLRDEIRTAQSALREQAKANESERERIRKERERMAEQAAEQQKRANAASAAAGQSATPNATENASGGRP